MSIIPYFVASMNESWLGMSDEELDKVTMKTVTEEDYQFLSLDDLRHPTARGHYELIPNAWWSVHPDKGAAFYNPPSKRPGHRRMHGIGAPQCNTSKVISEKVAERAHPFPHEIVYIELAFVPIDIRDWQY